MAGAGSGAAGAADCDVLVVGYGPVGQVLAILLAQYGHRVCVAERWAEAYPRPRAVHYDDEIARVFAAAGAGPQIAAVSEPAGEYDWRNASGATLLHFDWGGVGRSGWPAANMFSQPDLEAVLADRAGALPGVDVRRGCEVVGLADRDDHVEATVLAAGHERTVTARYAVGCDGANSFVRQNLGVASTDLGFFYDWLILDVVPQEAREWKPVNLQICDPQRPTTVVSGGPGRRRWEFMRLPGETVAELNTAETAWRLLAPWDLTPDNAELERHTVYTFQARWAERWRAGRVLIAGDAAHLMPPFAGQGMCSGIRDAANLAWKLDLVLSERAGDGLLDSYGSERSAHVQNAIGMSVGLGNVICLTDPAGVAARDEVMTAAGGRPELVLPPIPPAVLGPGVLAAGADGAAVGLAGQLSPQGRVARVGETDGAAGRFDELVGTGFVVAASVDLSPVLSERVRAVLDRLGAHVVRFVAPGAEAGAGGGGEVVADVDGVYLAWLEAAGCEAVVIRPDFYLFGGVPETGQLPALLEEMFAKLGLQGN